MVSTTEFQPGCERLGRYIRQLRIGYGYTLRRVQEHSQELGEPIDNSQLSRFEKGKSAPSFDKLRVLARVFNIPVQVFSDILDLQEFEALKPRRRDPEALYQEGLRAYKSGDFGRSFVTFERLAEVSRHGRGTVSAENHARARYHMAVALKRMGRLSMAEVELRRLLRCSEDSYPLSLRVRALLQMSFVYRELGDLYLASVIARECHMRAADGADEETVAAALNTAGIIEEEQEHFEQAATHFRAALEALRDEPGRDLMRITVQANLGGALAANGRFKAGMVLLRQCLQRARAEGYRRAVALCLTKLGTALSRRGQHETAQDYLRESDHVAGTGPDRYNDLLFINAYLNWRAARESGRVTQERILFGRMKYLRASLESRFKEVDEFDAIVRGKELYA